MNLQKLGRAMSVLGIKITLKMMRYTTAKDIATKMSIKYDIYNSMRELYALEQQYNEQLKCSKSEIKQAIKDTEDLWEEIRKECDKYVYC